MATTTSIGTTKQVENTTTDSLPWGATLLNNGTGVAVVWAEFNTANLYLNMVNHGAAVGPKITLDMGGSVDATSEFHVAAAGTDRFVVVAGDFGDGPPYTAAYMRVFDGTGAGVSSVISLGNAHYYDVKGVVDGSFIVT